jgi:hypothetical protein
MVRAMKLALPLVLLTAPLMCGCVAAVPIVTAVAPEVIKAAPEVIKQVNGHMASRSQPSTPNAAQSASPTVAVTPQAEGAPQAVYVAAADQETVTPQEADRPSVNSSLPPASRSWPGGCSWTSQTPGP